jgi:hypothetical protein
MRAPWGDEGGWDLGGRIHSLLFSQRFAQGVAHGFDFLFTCIFMRRIVNLRLGRVSVPVEQGLRLRVNAHFASWHETLKRSSNTHLHAPKYKNGHDVQHVASTFAPVIDSRRLLGFVMLHGQMRSRRHS